VAVEPFSVVRACDLAQGVEERRWLVRGVWGHRAHGVVGGAPKVGKSWFGLDIAVSVASGTPCLGHFAVDDPGTSLVYLAVDDPGTSLVYLAEDDEQDVRSRLDALCIHRGLEFDALDVRVITVPVLRLDREHDRQRLVATLEQHRPRLLLLDPLVRIHRLDDNSAMDISGLLGFLTEVRRRYEMAVVLVHHTSKKHRARPGQSLRGSSDLHAWGASNAYLTQRRDELVLTLEHRAAPSPEPFALRLVSRSDGTATHLEVAGVPNDTDRVSALTERVLDLLKNARQPLLRKELRERLRVSNNRLGDALNRLELASRIDRSAKGWTLSATNQQPSQEAPQIRLL